MKQYLKVAFILFAICAVAAILLGFVNSVTAPRIALNAANETAEALSQVAAGYSLGDRRDSDASGINFIVPLTEGSAIKGYVLELTGTGYGGGFTMIASFGVDGSVLAAKMMTNSETPGLGKKSEESWYMLQFVGTGAGTPIPSSKNDLADPSAVSGASVTFGGVTTALRNGSEYVKSLGGK